MNDGIGLIFDLHEKCEALDSVYGTFRYDLDWQNTRALYCSGGVKEDEDSDDPADWS